MKAIFVVYLLISAPFSIEAGMLRQRTIKMEKILPVDSGVDGDSVCSKYETNGFHAGEFVKYLNSYDSPNGLQWTWEQCAKECALFSACEFWILRLNGNKACLLMANKGIYYDRGEHVEGSKDLDCLSPPSRSGISIGESPILQNSKRGLVLRSAQDCIHLKNNHNKISWWHSLSTTPEISCDDFNPELRSDHTRKNLDQEFVPMFSSYIPSKPFNKETEDILQNAGYLMTFDEPEQKGQASISPMEAAAMWPQIISIASDFNLKIVAPCSVVGNGRAWYHHWLESCNSLYGKACDFDYTCLHAYYQPQPCDGIDDWACIGMNGSNAVFEINSWYNDFRKPIIAEFACNSSGGGLCTGETEHQLIQQFIPLLENSEAIFRYAWIPADLTDVK